MAPVKSSNFFSEILAVLNWLDWLGIAVALILAGVLAYLIWQRKCAKDGIKLAMPEILVPDKLTLPADCLTQVWHHFVSGIPWRLRAEALSAPLSLVLGDTGSGKTGVIDRYANWQGQEFSFRPSAVDDPLLQIYLGAKALVLEFNASLVYDTNPAAFHAIKKLWRHLPPKPQAVLVVDAGSLLSPQTDLLRQSGHAMFGKLDIFGKLEGKPLPLVLTLTHMDQVPGFVEFCAFLEQAGIPLQIEFPQQDGLNRLNTCLDEFQQHLPRALLTCEAQDYLKVVGFLNEAPRIFKVLTDFVRVAGLEQQTAAPPIVRLCLTSEKVHSFGCNPFAPLAGAARQPLITLNNHAKAALVLLALGMVYLIWSYKYQQNLEAEVFENIKTVRNTPVEYYAQKISPLFLNYSADLNKNALLTFMPRFFTAVDEDNKYLLITEIRKYYLFPLLQQIQQEPDADFKTIRLIGLLYSASNNEIARIMAKSPEKNPFDMDKYGLLISDYIQYNSHTEELDSILNAMNFTNPDADTDDLAPWLVLFRSLTQLLKKPYITQTEFKTLQQRLNPFHDVVNRFEFYSDGPEIRKWLAQHTNLHLNFSDLRSIQSELRQKDIGQLIGFIHHLEFSDHEKCPDNLSLKDCLVIAQAVANSNPPVTVSDMNFTLSGEYFSFSPKTWMDFMIRSRVTMILRDFKISRSKPIFQGWIFFRSPYDYADIQLNSTNNGQLMFVGKAKIDGRLTNNAFEQEVKPSILALTNIVNNLPIDAYEQKRFNEFVLTNLNNYTDFYVSAYLHFIRQFQVRIKSPWELNQVLTDLQEPDSQLQETLSIVKTNTALNLSNSSEFIAFSQKLAVFSAIQRLMEEKNGVYPELQKYQAIMAQMQLELNSHEPYAPQKSDGNAGVLKGTLTPIGRAAWAILLKEDGAYTTLVKNWLQNVGIQQEWQQPFLAPVQSVADFGSTQINEVVFSIWSDLWDSNIVPLLGKFPFRADAGRDKELALDELIHVFHPKQGVFWSAFQDYLSPLCTMGNQLWSRRHDLSDRIEFPANFLQRLNAVQQLSAGLWDAQGNPKPLQFSVKPGILPVFDKKRIPGAPLVSLTYLRDGGTSVLGFNQQADWQKFPLEWWASKPAQVGMEFRNDDDPARVYAETNTDGSEWNFFRLLQQGQASGTLQYRWQLAHPNYSQQPLNVEFSFKTNPLALFANVAGS